MDNRWTLHNGMPFHSRLWHVLMSPSSEGERGEVVGNLIRWFLPLEGIVCSRYILQMVVVCDKEVNGIGNERGIPGPHIRVQG